MEALKEHVNLLAQESLSLEIYKIIEEMSSVGSSTEFCQVPLYNQLVIQIQKTNKLTFILPAFPAKSSNRDKTISPLPDYGEVLGLRALNTACQKISNLYPPGVEMVICSDGRVFNDIVMVSDENLIKYKEGIKLIIQSESLSYLRTFSLDDCFEHQNFLVMREYLENHYALPLELIKQKVKNDEGFRSMFNGVHRFMKEDMSNLLTGLSKNQLMKESKKVTYEVIRRSGAWDLLLKKYFPDTLRLSIHPYPNTHSKFGVQLVEASDQWATPWHNVTIKMGDQFLLTKRKNAIAMGAKLSLAEGRYAFYEIS